MRNKKLLFLVLFLAVALAVSGCGKKETPKQLVVDNVGNDEQVDENVDTSLNIPDEPEPVENGDGEEIDTSDWQTYRNEEYGFEVRYPGEWEDRFNQAGQQEDDSTLIKYQNLFYISKWGETQKEGTEFYDGAYFKINILIDNENINLKEFVENNIKSKKETQKTEEILFNNLQSFQDTTKIIYGDHIIEQSRVDALYFKFNNNIYRIVCYAVGPKYL